MLKNPGRGFGETLYQIPRTCSPFSFVVVGAPLSLYSRVLKESRDISTTFASSAASSSS